MITCAPWSASALAVSYPMPLLAPVTRATRPVRSPMSAALQVAPPVTSLPGIRAHALPMWSAGTVPSLPAWKSSKAWMISARVFMTKGPWA